MKTWIEVVNRKEGEFIRRALEEPDIRAFVKVVGTLKPLPSDRARMRVLRHVADYLDEESHARNV